MQSFCFPRGAFVSHRLHPSSDFSFFIAFSRVSVPECGGKDVACSCLFIRFTKLHFCRGCWAKFAKMVLWFLKTLVCNFLVKGDLCLMCTWTIDICLTAEVWVVNLSLSLEWLAYRIKGQILSDVLCWLHTFSWFFTFLSTFCDLSEWQLTPIDALREHGFGRCWSHVVN